MSNSKQVNSLFLGKDYQSANLNHSIGNLFLWSEFNSFNNLTNIFLQKCELIVFKKNNKTVINLWTAFWTKWCRLFRLFLRNTKNWSFFKIIQNLIQLNSINDVIFTKYETLITFFTIQQTFYKFRSFYCMLYISIFPENKLVFWRTSKEIMWAIRTQNLNFIMMSWINVFKLIRNYFSILKLPNSHCKIIRACNDLFL